MRNKKFKDLQEEPFLSIITPVYNGESSILNTIESIKMQGFKNYEYIIIDSNSNDGTANIIKQNRKFVDKYIVEKDKGIYDAMNKGIRNAEGKFIGIINADDQYNENAFISVYEAFKKYENQAIFFSDLIVKYLLNKIIMKADNKISSLGSGTSQISHPTMFVPREIYLKYGGFDLNFDTYGADRELILRLKNKKIKFIKIDKELSIFNFGGATSKYGLENILKQTMQEFRLLNKYFPSHKALKTTIKFFYRLGRNFFLSLILPKKIFLNIRLKKLGFR